MSDDETSPSAGAANPRADEDWEHLGDAGPHEGHRLHADDMQDVRCQTCAVQLTDDEAAIAWGA